MYNHEPQPKGFWYNIKINIVHTFLFLDMDLNICHTLALRHEQLQSYLRLDDSSFSVDIEVGPGMYITIIRT